MSSRPGVLLLAHRFAPYSRIGAYRWVRLSCRLARLGHPVFVLTVNWPAMEEMDWLKEASEPGVEIHRTRSGYPQWLQYFNWPRPFDSTLGRGVRHLARQFPAYDEAERWGKYLLEQAHDLAQRHKLSVLIATGGPFSTMAHGLRIKQALPSLSLVLDYRDPWFLSLDEARSSGRIDEYREGLRLAEAVVGVTPEMTALLRSHVDKPQGRFETIENGVDLGHLASLTARYPTNLSQPGADFVHAGSLYSGRHVPLIRFFDWMRRRRSEGAPIRLRLIGRADRSLPSFCGDLISAGDVQILPSMSQSAAFQEILSSKIALHLNAPGTNDTQVSTKLIEYAGLGRPSLSLNYGGAVDSLVKEAGLGWSLHASAPNLEAELDAIVSNSGLFSPRIERFDFDRLAQRYSTLITELSG